MSRVANYKEPAIQQSTLKVGSLVRTSNSLGVVVYMVPHEHTTPQFVDVLLFNEGGIKALRAGEVYVFPEGTQVTLEQE